MFNAVVKIVSQRIYRTHVSLTKCIYAHTHMICIAPSPYISTIACLVHTFVPFKYMVLLLLLWLSFVDALLKICFVYFACGSCDANRTRKCHAIAFQRACNASICVLHIVLLYEMLIRLYRNVCVCSVHSPLNQQGTKMATTTTTSNKSE